MPRTKCLAIIASIAAVVLTVSAGRAQQPPPQAPNMTFFVSSTGSGKGADLGGLEGPELAQDSRDLRPHVAAQVS